LLDVEGNRKQSAALDALLARIGATPDKRVILVCSGGVRSAAAYAVLRSLGRRNVANYDGSMWEWSRHPSLPIQTGPGQPLLTAAEE
jgi:3-mercaptopyruvate sulfurtransferase SseA